jgi:hypothetical protein
MVATAAAVSKTTAVVSAAAISVAAMSAVGKAAV